MYVSVSRIVLLGRGLGAFPEYAAAHIYMQLACPDPPDRYHVSLDGKITFSVTLVSLTEPGSG